MTTGVNNQKARVVPGIPLAALDAIKDQHTQAVLRALVDAAHVRNGDTGNGDNRFVTAKELGNTAGQIGREIARVEQAIPAPSKFVDVGAIVADAQAQVIESALFRDLGQRITLIDAPRGIIESMKDKLLEASNKLLDELRDAVDNLPDGITDLSKIFDGAIQSIKGIKRTLYSPTGAFPLAQAAILDINNVSVDSKSANASKLAGLSAAFYDPNTGLPASRADYAQKIETEAKAREAVARMVTTLNATVYDPSSGLEASRTDYTRQISLEAKEREAVAKDLEGLTAKLVDPKTGRSYAEGMIATERIIELTNSLAIANEAHAVYASLGSKNRTFVSANPPTPVAGVAGSPYVPAFGDQKAIPAVKPVLAVPMEGDIWYDSDDKMKARRYNGSSWVDVSDVRIGLAEGAIVEERNVRLSQDKVIVDALRTVWGALGGNSGLIQYSDKVEVNTAGAVATAFQQVQTALKGDDGRLISSAAVKVTAETAVDRAGKIESKWIVNLDSGGAATGFRQAGFGISGSQYANSVKYAFGVRADSFWVASPGQTVAEGESPPPHQVPFVIKTHYWTDSQGGTNPPGVYLNELFATSAKIGIATITTAHIKDANITTLKLAGDSVMVGVFDQCGASDIYPNGVTNLMSRTLDLGDGYNSGVIVSGVLSIQAMQNASYGIRVYIEGQVAGDLRGSLQAGYPVLVPFSGYGKPSTRNVTVTLQAYNPSGIGGNVALRVNAGTMSCMGGKR